MCPNRTNVVSDFTKARPAHLPGAIGKYEIVAKIATGSMGTVYLGSDPYTDNPVAIKVSRWDKGDDADDDYRRRMFFNEVNAAQHLNHRNIVSVIDAGFTDAYAFLVMEYVEGGMTLAHYLKGSRLPVERIVAIAYQCARALAYAHSLGLIHRDFKPSNVLITPGMEAKIADFSIAHWSSSGLPTTQPSGFSGTPLYMSPEQATEDRISAQTDIFSLGVVLYELLTGCHPFAAENLSRLVYRVCHEAPRPMADFHPAPPNALQAIVAKALQKDISCRYQSAYLLAEDLLASFGDLEQTAAELEAEERFRQVSALDFFRGFPVVEVSEIVRTGAWESYVDGGTVVAEGEQIDVFYVIVAGSVRVIKQGVHIMSLQAGDCFGEMGYLAKAKRTATVQAAGTVHVLRFSPQVMGALSTSCQVRFLKVFLRTLILRLSRTTDEATGCAGDE